MNMGLNLAPLAAETGMSPKTLGVLTLGLYDK